MSEITAQRYDEEVPVLIVGGSVVGLSMALFLAQHGISALVVERHATTSIHARAGGFHTRTMEFFRQAGIDAAIQERARPPRQDSAMSFLRMESLVGKVLDDSENRAHQQVALNGPFASPMQMAAIVIILKVIGTEAPPSKLIGAL